MSLFDQEHLYLFLSLDFVGSTTFKTRQPKSVLYFEHFFYFIEERMQMFAQENRSFYFWKSSGDEVVYFFPVEKRAELKAALSFIEQSMACFALRKQRDSDFLPLKAACWLAHVSGVQERRLGIKQLDREYILLNIETYIQGKREFIGRSMDEGFRIANQLALAGFLVVDFSIAYLLCKYCATEHELYWAEGEILKGIWEERPYPAFYFCTDIEAVRCSNHQQDLNPPAWKKISLPYLEAKRQQTFCNEVITQIEQYLDLKAP